LIEKSAASEAYLPSFPTIPTPTWDSKIIPTSLPPSPTEQVLLPVNKETFFVTIAFCVGLHLHTQTQGALVATEKNFSSNLGVDKQRSRV